MNYIEQMKAYIAKEEEILSGLDLDSVNNLMNVLEKARKDGRTVFICGNGGSAATASHFVCDFCKGVSLNQEKKYNFECLSDNTPLMTAIANDIGYDDIFVIPLKAKMHPGDVVVGISGSGNSENVVRALRYAADHGALGRHTVMIHGIWIDEVQPDAPGHRAWLETRLYSRTLADEGWEVTVVELDDDYYAQIWIDAPDRLQLRQAMNVAEHLAFR